jgi:hypothetical protein
MTTATSDADALRLLKEIITSIRTRGSAEPVPPAPGVVPAKRVDAADFDDTLTQAVTALPLEQHSTQNDFIIDKKTADAVARSSASLATPRTINSGVTTLKRVIDEHRQRRIAAARARMLREQEEAVSGVDRLPSEFVKTIPETPILDERSAKRRRSQRGSVQTPRPPTPEPEEPPPPQAPLATELTLGNLARELREPDSLARALFLKARRANLQAWLPKIAQRRAEVVSRQNGRVVYKRPSAPAKKEPPRKRSFIVEDDDESALNSTTDEAAAAGGDDDTDDPQADVDEIEFEKMLLARLNLLETQITDELSPTRSAVQRPEPTPKPVSRTTRRRGRVEEVSDDVDADDVGGLLNGAEAEQRQRDDAVIDNAARALESLNTMTGLELLKNSVTRVVVSALVNPTPVAALFADHRNILLMGEPGTGKTESAGIIGNIMRAIGLVADQNRNVYASYTRADLIAGVIGGTSIRVRYKFAVSWGNMMFIDEIYALNSGNEDSYGREAIDAIVKFSDDFKGEVLLIGAGYETLIRTRVFPINSGFSSRFPNQWLLSNYSSKQLQVIVRKLLRRSEPAAPRDQLPAPPAAPATPPRALDITSADAIQAELIDRAHEMGYFRESNARGARNLVNALLDQRRVRIFAEVFNRKAGAYGSFAAVARSESDLTPADVYRGFLTWMLSARNEHVYYLDPRVDALVVDLE